MLILSVYPLPGISYTHDANACLVSDDGVLFASEEERHMRGQHAIGHVPERAAMSAFRETRRRPDEVELLVTTSMERCRRRTDYATRLQFTRELLQIPPSVPALCVPHHLAHSALSVLTSPFDDCLFLTLDAGGDSRMGHWGTFRHGRFRIVESFDLSPGLFFSFVTTLCGFPLFEEGKAMGLAAHGQVDDRLLQWFRSGFSVRPGSAALETPWPLEWSHRLDLERIDPDSFPRHKYHRWSLDFRDGQDRDWLDAIPVQDIARTGQFMFEELIDRVVSTVVERSGIDRIACAGGAFLNVSANGELARRHPDAAFHLPVASHDAGLALGGALWARHIHGRSRVSQPVSPYIGPSFTTDDIETALRNHAVQFEQPADFARAVARAIAEGEVVGWFDGPAEYGARALGSRSVLADPRRPEIRARLNQLLKQRDWFMPYAPTILAEYAADYLEHFTPGPYMNTAFRVRPAALRAIPAAVHVDGTCRAHAISRAMHPAYYDVVAAFRDLTGVPAILNTSFNRHGVPMVSTPRQAVQHLLEGCVDVLAMGGRIARREHAGQRGAPLVPDDRQLPLMSLRRVAELGRLGRRAAAEALAARAGLDVVLSSTGLSWKGTCAGTWRFDEPAAELSRRWLEDDSQK